ncbi:hypothetical protein FRC12_024257 [Ceratobasidium sp. 428]|nr:hypothetical protein FRC12_024257 [Ceratobasidium sp. 428]
MRTVHDVRHHHSGHQSYAHYTPGGNNTGPTVEETCLRQSLDELLTTQKVARTDSSILEIGVWASQFSSTTDKQPIIPKVLEAGLYFFSEASTSVTYFADRQASLTLASVSVDGLAPDRVNLTSLSPQFQQPVWSKNVSDGDHQLVIEHVGSAQANIMIDYINILSTGDPASTSAGLGATQVGSSAQFIDDTDPNIQYSPNNWRFVTEGLFYNTSSQVTQTRGASFQLKFNGTAIWYFTDVGPDHGNVTISIDEDEIDGEVASGYAPRPLAQRLIWSKTDLEPGTHTINITHSDTDGKYATLDFFRYNPSAGTEPGSKKSVPAGVIVGAVIAGLFFLGIVYCAFLCWASPRFRSREAEDGSAPPPSYGAANRSSRSSGTTTSNHPYRDAADSDSIPLGGAIPMANVMPLSESGRYPVRMSMNAGGEESSGPTPAQRYMDSIRASMVGSGTVSDSGVEMTPQMAQRGAAFTLSPRPDREEAQDVEPRRSPPSYQR